MTDKITDAMIQRICKVIDDSGLSGDFRCDPALARRVAAVVLQEAEAKPALSPAAARASHQRVVLVERRRNMVIAPRQR